MESIANQLEKKEKKKEITSTNEKSKLFAHKRLLALALSFPTISGSRAR
jgi:hypothetical protein